MFSTFVYFWHVYIHSYKRYGFDKNTTYIEIYIQTTYLVSQFMTIWDAHAMSMLIKWLKPLYFGLEGTIRTGDRLKLYLINKNVHRSKQHIEEK